MSHRKVLVLGLLLAACGSSGRSSTIVPAYLAGDSCHDLGTSAACGAQSGCRWIDVASLPCPNNSNACPTGQCVAVDPCASYADEKTCEADSADHCLWAGVATLCPAGSNCSGDGFCFQGGDGGGGTTCACACPDYCVEGQPCPPPCGCDCPSPPPIAMDAGTSTGGGGSGGGTCTCACPACAPGEACPPCDCNCNPPPGGGGGCPPSTGGGGGDNGGGGTCTCNCPSCPPGETCPDHCTCDCAGDAGVPMSTPGSGPGHKEPIQPCQSITDEAACTAQSYCLWSPNDTPCMNGQPCPAGHCNSRDDEPPTLDGGVSSCVCACPACAPDLDGGVCPPCNCDCPPPPPTCN